MSVDPYDVFIHEKLLTRSPRSGRQREQIMLFVRSLVDNPYQEGDYQDTGPAGNRLYIKLIGDYAVSYHVDHPVKEVKIVNIQQSDQA